MVVHGQESFPPPSTGPQTHPWQRRRSSGCGARSSGGPVAVAAPPSKHALDVLAGLLRDAVLLVARGTANPGDVDIAMRLGAGHPAGPLEILSGLTPEDRDRLGLGAPPAEADVAAEQSAQQIG